MRETLILAAKALHERAEQRRRLRSVLGDYTPEPWERLSPGRRRDFEADAAAVLLAIEAQAR